MAFNLFDALFKKDKEQEAPQSASNFLLEQTSKPIRNNPARVSGEQAALNTLNASIERNTGSYVNALGSVVDIFDGKQAPKTGSFVLDTINQGNSLSGRMYRVADMHTDKAAELDSQARAGRGSLANFGLDVLGGASDLAGDAALSLLAPGAGLAAMGVRSFGGGAQEARHEGKDLGKQLLTGAKSAAIEVLTEKLAGVGGKWRPEGKGWIDGAIDRAINGVIDRGGSAVLAKMAAAFGSEAAEEILSGVLNPLADRMLKLDPNAKVDWGETLYEGLIGGTLGIFGGMSEGVQLSRDVAVQRAQAAAAQAIDSSINEQAARSASAESQPQGDIPAPPNARNAATEQSGEFNRVNQTSEAGEPALRVTPVAEPESTTAQNPLTAERLTQLAEQQTERPLPQGQESGIIEAESQNEDDLPFTFGEENDNAGQREVAADDQRPPWEEPGRPEQSRPGASDGGSESLQGTDRATDRYIDGTELDGYISERLAGVRGRVEESQRGIPGRGDEAGGVGAYLSKNGVRKTKLTDRFVHDYARKLSDRGVRFLRGLSESQLRIAEIGQKYGCMVLFADNLGGLGVHNSGVVVINASLSQADAVKTFVHEFTHNRIREKLLREEGWANPLKFGGGADPFRTALAKHRNNPAVFNAITELYTWQLRTNREGFAQQLGTSYDRLTPDLQKAVKNSLVEELFCEIVCDGYEDFQKAGMSRADFDALRADCIKAALDEDIFTGEELDDIGVHGYEGNRADVSTSDLTQQTPRDPNSWTRSLEQQDPGEKEAPITEESPFNPAEQERQRLNDEYEEQRDQDRRGIDGSANAEWRRGVAERQAQHEAEREANPDPEASYQMAARELGEKAHKAVRDSAAALSEMELAIDEENDGVAKYPESKAKLDAVRQALDGLGKGTVTAEQLAEAYNALNNADDTQASYYFDERVAKLLERTLGDVELMKASPVSTPTYNQERHYQEHVVRAVTMMRTTMERADRILREERRPGVSEINNNATEIRRGLRGMLAAAGRKFNLMQTRPELFMRMLGGFDPKAGKTMYRQAEKIDAATAAKINTHMAAESEFRDVVGMKGWDDFSRGKTKTQTEVPGIGKVSMNYALGLLKTLETRGAIRHIAEHGVQFAVESELYKGQNNAGQGNKPAYGPRVELNETELMDLRGALKKEIMSDPVAKAAYEASRKSMSVMRKAINAVSQRLYGVDLASEDASYWHMEIARRGGTLELVNDQTLGLEDMGLLQAREGSSGALFVRPFTDAMSRYIDKSSDFTAFAELSSDLEFMSKAFGNEESMLGAIQNSFGDEYVDWMKTYVADLNSQNSGKTSELLSRLRSNLAQSSLLLNGSVALKQTPSYWDAAGVVDYDILFKNRKATKSARSWENDPIVKKVNELTHFLESRKVGYNTVETGDLTAQGRTLGGRVANALPNWMTNWINKSDFRTVANLTRACYEQTLRNDPTLEKDSDAHLQATAALFEKAVLHTQPIYNKQYRAEYMRSQNEWVRMFAMFRTQQTQNLNNIMGAVGEYQAAKKSGDAEAIKAAKSQLTNTVGGQVTANAAFALLSGLARLLLHKKDDFKDEEGEWDAGEIAKRLGLNFVGAMAGTVWFGDKVAGLLIDTVSRGETSEFYEFSSGADALISNLASGIKTFAAKPSVGNGKKLAVYMAEVFGIPLGNAYNMVNTVIMYSLDAGQSFGLNDNGSDGYSDIIRMVESYNKMSDAQRAAKTVETAMRYYAAGERDKANLLLASMDYEESEGKVKAGIKSAYADGKIKRADAMRILTEYAGMDKDKAETTLAGWDNDAEYQANKDENPELYATIEMLLKDVKKDADAYDSSKDAAVIGGALEAGATDEQADTLTDKYGGKPFRTGYGALRDGGYSASEAVQTFQQADADNNGSLKQEEVWKWYEAHPKEESVAILLWSAYGWKTSWSDFKAKHSK